MSTGRARLEIGTYGDINTVSTAAGTVKAEARYRDWDGEIRKVTATASTVTAAKQALLTGGFFLPSYVRSLMKWAPC